MIQKMKNWQTMVTLAALFCMTLMPVRAQLINGQLWPDVEGNHINAHGGCILKHGDTYYWYGEQRPDPRPT